MLRLLLIETFENFLPFEYNFHLLPKNNAVYLHHSSNNIAYYHGNHTFQKYLRSNPHLVLPLFYRRHESDSVHCLVRLTYTINKYR